MIKRFFLPLLLISFLPGLLTAQQYMIENGHAEFHSEVPLHSFTGVSDKLIGLIDLDDATVDFYVDLTTFETGINKRDKDMRETLETDQYPFAEFFGKLISDFDIEDNSSQPATVRGNLPFMGSPEKLKSKGHCRKHLTDSRSRHRGPSISKIMILSRRGSFSTGWMKTRI